MWIPLGLFCLNFTHLLESIGLCLLPNLGNFQPLFYQVHFQPHPHSPPSRVQRTQVGSFVVVPRGPEALFIFSFYCLSMFQIRNSYFSFFHCTDLSSVLFILLRAYPVRFIFLTSVTVFFSCKKIFIWFFKVSVYLLILCFSICSKHFHHCSLDRLLCWLVKACVWSSQHCQHHGAGVYWLPLVIQLEIFLVLCVTYDFHLKPEYCGCDLVRLGSCLNPHFSCLSQILLPQGSEWRYRIISGEGRRQSPPFSLCWYLSREELADTAGQCWESSSLWSAIPPR